MKPKKIEPLPYQVKAEDVYRVLGDKIMELIDFCNSLGEKEEVKLPGHKCPYWNDDCPKCCKEVKPSWEEGFDKEFKVGYQWADDEFVNIAKWGEVKDFIRKLLSEGK